MNKKRIQSISLLTVSAILIGCGIIYAGIIIGGYRQGQKEYEDLVTRYTLSYSMPAEDNSQTESNENQWDQQAGEEIIAERREDSRALANAESILPADAPEMIMVDFDSLLKENQDVIAWISIPAIGISYPVLQADDNEYYLHRDLEGNYLFAGSIFADSCCSRSFDDYNTILYGHNMRDGSMFAGLRKFQDEETLQKCKYFWIYTPERSRLYEICSIHPAAVGSDTYMIRFASSEIYSIWLKKMKELSDPATDIILSSGDRLVTLSTCTETSSTRMAGQGKLVWSGSQKPQ